MRRIIITALQVALAATVLVSCENEVQTPVFDVSTVVEKTTVMSEDETGEVDAYKVTFRFTGAPDNIVFYSGEEGADYRYRDRYTRAVTPYVSFNTAYTGGMPNTLSVLVSNDFQPEYEYLSGAPTTTVYTRWAVQDATWTDITDRFRIPGNKLQGDTQYSGEAILSEFHGNMPLFIAFRFKGAEGEASSPGLWSFSDFNIRNELQDGTSEAYISNGIGSSWKSVDLRAPVQCSRGTGSASLSASADPDIDTYLISAPYYPSNLQSGKGLAIKSIDENLTEYTYTYVAPEEKSVYVAFVATNSLYGESRSIVRAFELDFE